MKLLSVRVTLSRMDWQHGVLAGALLVTTVGPDLVTWMTEVGLPHEARVLAHVVALVTGLLALAKQLKPAPEEKPKPE